MFKNYIKTAWRSIGKQKLYSVINIVGFGIAVAAILIISLWVQNEFRYDRYHSSADRIYLVKNTQKYEMGNSTATENSPEPAVNHLQSEFSDIEEVAYAVRPREMTIKRGDEFLNESEALYVSRSWFDVFDFDFVYGNPHSFLNQIQSLIITEKKAREYFGTTNAVGKTLQIDSVNYEVQGVVKDIPSHSSFRFELFLPFDANPGRGDNNNWIYFTTKVFVRLKAGSQPQKTEQQIQYLFEKNVIWTQEGISIQSELLPLTKLHFDKDISSATFQLGNYETVIVFFGLSVLLLVVASINYVNIIIAKAVSRRKEIGTRKVIGATRGQLFAQFSTEAFLSCTLALVLALLLTYLILPHFNQYFEITLLIGFLSFHVVALVIGVWFTMVLLTGLLPAIYLSSFKPVSLFSGSVRFQFGGKAIRRSLLVSQFVLAVFMVIASVVMHSQLSYIQANEVDYNRLQVFMVELPTVPYRNDLKEGYELSEFLEWAENREKFETNRTSIIKNELLTNNAIKNVSVSVQSSVLNEQYKMVGELDWEGKDPDFQPHYATWVVDDDFQEIMNLEFVQGEWFLKGEDQGLNQILLNETAVKEFEITQPIIGRRFYSNGIECTIVGIVKDFHFQDLHHKISPMVIEKKS